MKKSIIAKQSKENRQLIATLLTLVLCIIAAIATTALAYFIFGENMSNTLQEFLTFIFICMTVCGFVYSYIFDYIRKRIWNKK